MSVNLTKSTPASFNMGTGYVAPAPTIPLDQYDPRVIVRADKRDWRHDGDHYGKRQPRKARRQGTRSGVLAAVRREGGFA